MDKRYLLPIAFIVIGLLALCYGIISGKVKDTRLPVSNNGFIADKLVGTYDIHLTMKQTTYPIDQTTQVFYQITNASENDIVYGQGNRLEKLVEDEWRLLDKKIQEVPSIGVLLPSKTTDTYSIVLDDFDYHFTSGTYRIIKPFLNSFELAVSFTLV